MATIYGKGFTSGLVLASEAVAFGTLGTTGIAVPFISETLTAKPDYVPHDIKIGKGASAYPSIVGNTDVDGTIVCKVDYDNMARFFIQTTGDAATLFVPADEVTQSTSVIVNRNVERLQYTGGVIEEMRIMGSIDNNNSLIMMESDWFFQKRTVSSDAILSASLTSSTYAKMSELVFRIGTQADELAAVDAIAIQNFVIRFKNNFKIVRGSGSAFIVQPVRDLPREVTLDITVSNYSDTGTALLAIVAALRAHSALAADFTFTASAGSITITIPELYPMDLDNMPIADDKILSFPVKLRAYKNTSAIMATTTEEIAFALA